ncbi:hypothetical protein PUN28_000972 [Cardiocondyla obscurior]|uniref:Uncharacterized protein n=1 Tax=Cardiocondyla obscurior TaxID=286306 RepID=A0AAW2H2D5_9HYME
MLRGALSTTARISFREILVSTLGTSPTTITGNEILLREIFQIEMRLSVHLIVATSEHSGRVNYYLFSSVFENHSPRLRESSEMEEVSPSTLVRIGAENDRVTLRIRTKAATSSVKVARSPYFCTSYLRAKVARRSPPGYRLCRCSIHW